MDSIMINEIAAWFEQDIIEGNRNGEATGICLDSRKIKHGDVFVAIKGENFNGNSYIEDALDNGAKVVIYDAKDRFDAKNASSLFIQVNDSVKALGKLSHCYRKSHHVAVVGVTGSVGKTTTRNIIAHILAEKGNVVQNEGNKNNEIGVPLTLFNIGSDTDFAVIEMGMRGLGEIKYLTEIALPEKAVITNIGESHMEILGNKDNILKAKSEIAAGFNSENTVFIYGDDSFLPKISSRTKARIVTFGLEEHNDYYAKNINTYESMTVFDLIHYDYSYKIELNLPGRHNIINALAAFAVGDSYGIPPKKMISSLQYVPGIMMRNDIITHKSGIVIINDTYNASPKSMKAAINLVNDVYKDHRKFFVIGDMLELGPDSEKYHYEIAEKINLISYESVITYGKRAKVITDALSDGGNTIHTNSIEEIVENLMHILKSGDVVLFKASRSMRLENAVEMLTNRLDNSFGGVN